MNEIDNTVERIAELARAPYPTSTVKYWVSGEHWDHEVIFSHAGLQALANAYTKAVADLATAKQGLEHYASKKRWKEVDVNESGWASGFTTWQGGDDGYTVAQQTLDAIGKE